MMFTAHNAHIIAALAIIFLIAGLLAAQPHEWYPSDCCGGNDCHPVPASELKPDGDGCWFHIPSSLHFCGNKVRSSPDGMYHVCISSYGVGYCAFIPPGT